MTIVFGAFVNMCFISIENQKISGHADDMSYLDLHCQGFEMLFELLELFELLGSACRD